MFIIISQLDSFIHFDEFNINTQNTTKRDSNNYACGTTAILCNACIYMSIENSLTLDVFVLQPQLTQALILVFCKGHLVYTYEFWQFYL